ncbi:MAG: DUF362 domain-containing protein [Deltaproteobacteria bacterium]|nr:DUF362 domain-containing protein [Deltaproteobacteria bacterium]
MAAAHVILRHCPEYDVGRVARLVGEGLDQLALRPRGRVLVKPNLVAAGKQFPYAYTRSEVAEGVLRALAERATNEVEELAIGERCGITIPTRMVFREAGYDEMLRRLNKQLPQPIKRYLFDETPQVEITLSHQHRLRDYIFTPEPVARADFFVNLPKFKAHPWTTVTFSLKNYIGIQDDRHRLIDHDHRLNEKITDLQYVLQPQFICVDGIIAGQGRMLTPKPFDLKLLVMGDNQVALDAVCSRIIGVDPLSVDHIRLAAEHGFGPIALDKIEISGDVTLAEAQSRATGFEVGLIRVEKYFEGSKISAYAGPPPEQEVTDYCWGGCPGAIEEAIEILRQYDADCDQKMPRMHIVFGAYRGQIDAKPGEPVLFIGDCANFRGEIHGQAVDLQSTYRPRETIDPHTVAHQDVYRKLLEARRRVRAPGGQPYLRLSGCPVSVAEQLFALATLGGTKNPLFDLSDGLAFNKAYLQWRFAVASKRMVGQVYQRPGGCPRGEAAVTRGSSSD